MATALRTCIALASASWLACGGAPDAAPIELVQGELLTNPTEHGVDVVLLSDEPMEYAAEIVAADGATSRTPVRSAGARELALVRIEGLEPGSEYTARVRLRRPGDLRFEEREPLRFRTLRVDRDAVVRFAYAADSHITGRFMKVSCGRGDEHETAIENFRRTVRHIAAADVDFAIAAGDNFMTHAPKMQSCPGVEAYGSGTVRTAAQADLRYELALSPDFLGGIARSVPMLYVLGNHDGEARFGDDAGSHGHFRDTRALSRAARLRHLPDPVLRYPGSREGLYYTFTSGDARFIVLDVMAGPDDYPRTAADWTLGEAQLAWFERVVRSDRRSWTFVFAEHLVGGFSNPDASRVEGGRAYHYGRGGLQSTLDETPRSAFRGEQATLQQIMRENGVDVFFHAHDHVAVVGEKLAPDGSGEGVFYALGGQASGDGRGPSWQDQPWFRARMDYDGDGAADFLGDRTGTLSPGFYRVTVRGRERIDLAYVGSDADPARDGKVVFQVSIFPDGTSNLADLRAAKSTTATKPAAENAVTAAAGARQGGR
ncbi:MAG: metallophosphoesterase [Myxococcales bacterium]|nr:metallophosphoesterase [Myxococcales bacterium]